MRLRERVAIVTGAGSGFGEGIAHRFVEEGACVIVNDVNRDAGERVAEKLRSEFGADRAAYQYADVANREDVRQLVAAAVERFGKLDILVNNAGVSNRNMPTLEIAEDDVDRILAVNIKAVWLGICEAVPVLRRQGGGAIINIASTGAFRPRPGLTIYNASKAAVVNMTKSTAVEFAPDAIRVNCICPVAGDTPLLATFMGEDSDEKRDAFRATIPLGRLSQPLDIANAALYLASEEAAFITGVALEVDGGRCV
ncbi:glucose 1-dehydrogenase [Halomonas sp. 3H]|uniref:glucose 1-dehydrogenase n=1 Tax=Halomonas sp. 3H TaxID=2952527 RepID=UPI0020B87A8D|nr:glucose 1-dehydrogenase [Halomonas sp. 3H]